MIGILEHIDGRKLTIYPSVDIEETVPDRVTVYLRKGVDSSQYLHHLQSVVCIDTVEEKGFQMVEKIRPAALTRAQPIDYSKLIVPKLPETEVAQERPSLPATAVEKTKPVDMPASSNVPKLNFGRAENFTGVVGGGTETVKVNYKPDSKQRIITASWAMGAVLNSPALAQANDALALSTQQTLERAKRVAEELIRWAEEQASK